MGFKFLMIIVTICTLVQLSSAEDNLYCIQCRRCGEALPEATECENESHVCYVEIDDGQIYRGCIKPDRCKGDNCETCNTDGCNKHLVCEACQDTSDCHRFGSLKICGATTRFCYSRIDEKGRTLRDCSSNQIANNCTGPLCETCSHVQCNSGPFPKDRLQCYQCTNCNEPYPSQAYACPLLTEDDQCFTDWDNNRRGCLSTGSDCASVANSNCSRCNSSLCNDQPLKIKQKTKCFKCNSRTDPLCLLNPEATGLQDCDSLKPALEEDRCFSSTTSYVTEKGCFYDRFEKISQCNAQNGCTHCTGEGCNNEAKPFQCIVCSSENNELCRSHPAKLSGQNCTKQIANNKCYTEVNSTTVTRGCFGDLSLEAQQKCQNYCRLCDYDNCNTYWDGPWYGDNGSLSSINLSLLIALLTIGNLL